MTSEEKLQNVINLIPPKDRTDIPVYPMMLTFPGRFAGATQQEMILDYRVWLKGLMKIYNELGQFDVSQGNTPGDVIFLMGLEAKRPGFELGVDELYQFIEQERMGYDDYRDIAKNGWLQWYNRYLMNIQNPQMKHNYQIIMRWIKLGMRSGKCIKYLQKRGIAPIHGTGMGPVFDTLSQIRSFSTFCCDLYDNPGPIVDALRRGTPETVELSIKNCKRTPIKRISVYAMRSGASAVSPAIFDEYVFPYLRQYVEAFYKEGITTVIHADGNWLPMLDRFLTLPKTSCHFELDGETDIYKAYDLLSGHHSIRGDVPAAMLAFGTPDEVSEYCERLVNDLGMKGGFMLGSGCEVPLNCKPENLKAMLQAVKKEI